MYLLTLLKCPITYAIWREKSCVYVAHQMYCVSGSELLAIFLVKSQWSILNSAILVSMQLLSKRILFFFLFKKSICHHTFFFYRKWVPLARTEPPNLSESLNWGKRTMAIVWSSSVSWVAIRSPRSPGFAKVNLITCFHDSWIYKSTNFFTKFSLIYFIQGKVGD